MVSFYFTRIISQLFLPPVITIKNPWSTGPHNSMHEHLETQICSNHFPTLPYKCFLSTQYIQDQVLNLLAYCLRGIYNI